MNASDVIAFIALMVGLQALLMVFYLKAIEKVRERHKKGLTQILRNKNQLTNIHEVLIGALSELSAIQRLYAALIIRLTIHTKLDNSGKISSEIGRYDFLLEKGMHEVNIFSSESIRRQSAIRALAEEYGDIYSLEIMQKCNEQFYNKKDPDLKSGIQILKSRINKRIENDPYLENA